MAELSRNNDGSIVLRLAAEEAEVVRRLVQEMHALLRQGHRSGDVAVGRLFPDAYESEEDAAAFRDLVGDELLQERIRGLDQLERTLGASGDIDVALSPDDVDVWLRTINDIRLTIGTRLEVDETKMAAELDERDPEAPALAVLHWLGWLQESFLESAGRS
jgi:hypothetical protein